MRLAVERAIEEAAPEVIRIDVDGLREQPPAPLLQIGGGLARGPRAISEARSSEPLPTTLVFANGTLYQIKPDGDLP